jgi:hypothetical protein
MLLGSAIRMVIPLLAAMNVQAMLIPAIIAGLVVLIGLAIDEIATFARGGETLFSRLYEKFEVFRETVENVLANIILHWDTFVKLIQNPFSTDNWRNFFDAFLGLFGLTIDKMKESIAGVLDPIRTVLIKAGLIDDEEADQSGWTGSVGKFSVASGVPNPAGVMQSAQGLGAMAATNVQKSNENKRNVSTDNNFNTNSKVTVERRFKWYR